MSVRVKRDCGRRRVATAGGTRPSLARLSPVSHPSLTRLSPVFARAFSQLRPGFGPASARLRPGSRPSLAGLWGGLWGGSGPAAGGARVSEWVGANELCYGARKEVTGTLSSRPRCALCPSAKTSQRTLNAAIFSNTRQPSNNRMQN